MPLVTNSDDGIRLYYEVEGDGSPLVLLHGFTNTTASWRNYGYVDTLQLSYRLILIDARGHGRSDKPRDLSAYRMPSRVADVIAVLDALEIDRAHVFGYSMGGRTCFALGSAVPDRLRSLIIGGASPYPEQIPFASDWIGMLRSGGMDALIAHFEGLGLDIPALWRVELEAGDPLALAAALEAMVQDPSLGDALPAIDVPILLFAGEDDSPVALEASVAAERLPDARYIEFAGLGHNALLRSDLVLPHVTAFLNESQQL